MSGFLAQLMALLEGYILLPLVWLWPLKWIVVPPGSTGVRFTLGRPGRDLQMPGVYLATIAQTLEKRHTARCVLASDDVELITADGVSLRIDIVTTYQITNLGFFLTQTEESQTYLATVSEALLLGEVRQSRFDELVVGMLKLENRLRDRLDAEMEPIGVGIMKSRIQNLRHVDPVTGSLTGVTANVERLKKGAVQLSEDVTGLSCREALMILSPAIQHVLRVDAGGRADVPVDIVKIDPAEARM